MALSSSVVNFLAPGLLSALQHVQYSAGVAAFRKLQALATAAELPTHRPSTTQDVVTLVKPPSWQSVVGQYVSPTGRRFNSTLTSMTMDAALGSNSTASKELLSALSSFTTQTVDERSASLPRLAEQLVHHVPQLQPEDIASVAMAFARMGFAHTGLTSALAMQVTLRMPLCSPEAVAQTAWAFGELQYYNYEFLAQLVEYMQQNYRKFSAPDLARVLWTLGKLGYQHELMVDLWHELSLKATTQLDCKAMAEVVAAEAMSGSGSTDDVTLQNMIADYAAANLASFDGDDLGKMAYGLMRFCYEDAELYDMMAKKAVEIWDTLNPTDVRRIMTAYGDLGHFSKELLDCIADKWLVAHADDPELQMPELRRIVRSFNLLGYSNNNISKVIKHRSHNM